MRHFFIFVAMTWLYLGLGIGPASAANIKTALFSAGHFWAAQKEFLQIPGVLNVVAGYTGGSTPNPSYMDVADHSTGHRLAVLVVYDPARVNYAQLLGFFWRHIDPTDAQGQFCDRGSQFTTALYYSNRGELAQILDSKMLMDADSQRFADKPVVTKILKRGAFYPAEIYHQNYAQKNPLRFRFYMNTCERERRLQELWGR